MKTARYCLPCTFSTRSTDTPLRRFFLSSARILTTCRPIRGELWGHVTSSPPTTADLVVVGGQHADLALLLPAPGLGPVAPELCQPVHNLRHLRVVVEGGAGGVLAVLAPDITSPLHCITSDLPAPGCEEGEGVPGGVCGLPAAGHQLLLVEHVAGVGDDVLVTAVVLAQQHLGGSTVQYSTVQYSTVQYSTVQYSTLVGQSAG